MSFLAGLAYRRTEDIIEEKENLELRMHYIAEVVDAYEKECKKLWKEQEEQNKITSEEWLDKFNSIFKQAVEIPDVCKTCSNHPSNGGSGICHCTVPYLNKQI